MSSSSVDHDIADFTFRLFFRHSSHAILVRPCVLEAVVESIGSSNRCSGTVLNTSWSNEKAPRGKGEIDWFELTPR